MTDQPTLDIADGGPADDGDVVEEVSILNRLEQSFLDYSMSVIVGRALPDVRDGLKPVQRRILYSMHESGLRPDRPYRKCASAVGEVMKKYHPHGDSSIYDALVRMAQDFSMRSPLVDGHGNFGSIDGDPPAAMRYTEARMAGLASDLLAGIDEDTVDFVPNYDGYDSEPTVLPSRFPNLLVNGSTGIAVGMATSMAPHNLGEVIDACLLLMRRPDATLSDLMRKVPAPDLPTGARIVDTDGIREAYATGRGAVTMEAVATTEVRSGNLPRIVVTEIPYLVNKAKLQERIADLVHEGKTKAIRDIRDESSRDGIRIVIELKRGEDPGRVLADLYAKTDLRTNFNVNNVCLVDGRPQTLGLKALLGHYVDFQRQVVTRRTEHRLAKARARLHVIEGLLTALDNIDAVVRLIRESDTTAHARSGLMDRFGMSEIQANAVLDMPLRRLAKLEAQTLRDEAAALEATIADLEDILASAERLDQVVADELAAIRDAHATPRRSVLVADGIDAADVLEGGSSAGFAAQDVTVTVTANGAVKAVATRRTSPKHTKERDPAAAVLRCDTDAKVLVVDAQGNGFRVDVADVPVGNARSAGTSVTELLGRGPDAPVAGAVVLTPGTTVATVSAAGHVKRTDADEYLSARTRDIQAAGVKGDDRIVAVVACRDADHLLVAHSAGYVIRFPASDVRPMGRTAAGVAGMNVPADAEVVSATVLPDGADDPEVVTVGVDGRAKRAGAAEYPAKGRGGKGVQTGASPQAFCGVAADLHVVAADGPDVLRVAEVGVAKRAARGDQAVDGPVASALAEQTGDEPAAT